MLLPPVIRVITSPWAKWVGLLLLLLALGAFLYHKGYRTGERDATTRADKAAREAYSLADARYRALEEKHAKQVDSIHAEYAHREVAEKKADAKVVGDLQLGIRRLRVKVASCTRDPQAASGSATPSGVDGGGTAELSPEVAGGLFSIASDGDRVVRKLTALQKTVRSIVTTCNGGAP